MGIQHSCHPIFLFRSQFILTHSALNLVGRVNKQHVMGQNKYPADNYNHSVMSRCSPVKRNHHLFAPLVTCSQPASAVIRQYWWSELNKLNYTYSQTPFPRDCLHHSRQISLNERKVLLTSAWWRHRDAATCLSLAGRWRDQCRWFTGSRCSIARSARQPENAHKYSVRSSSHLLQPYIYIYIYIADYI